MRKPIETKILLIAQNFASEFYLLLIFKAFSLQIIPPIESVAVYSILVTTNNYG